jgi:hypothetical protein
MTSQAVGGASATTSLPELLNGLASHQEDGKENPGIAVIGFPLKRG